MVPVEKTKLKLDLVDQLVERMLTVRPRLAPNNRTSGMIDLVSIIFVKVIIKCGWNLLSSPGDILSVALHISLLEVGGKPAVSVLILIQGTRMAIFRPV